MTTNFNIVIERNKLFETLHEQVKLELSQVFESFFQLHPEVKSIYWTQYANYFNDGDPCPFQIHPICALANEYDPEEDGQDWETLNSDNCIASSFIWKKEKSELESDLQQLHTYFSNITKVMEEAFGESVECWVNASNPKEVHTEWFEDHN